jgi:acetyl/propionyl-CoA carboxylase alpha subunit
MRLYLNGTEIEAAPESGFELVEGSDRIMVRTPSGSFSALAIRDGDAILVSYQGHQYRLETRRPRAGAQGAAASGEYRAPMPGQIVDVLVAVGDKVTKGQKLIVLEAMKTQQPFNAPFDGTVTTMNALKGAQVSDGELLVVVEEA